MDLLEHAREVLTEYRAAHLAWKAAPEGQKKVDAKRRRGQLHGKVLELAELLKSPAQPDR